MSASMAAHRTRDDGSDFETYYMPIYVMSAIFGFIFLVGAFVARKSDYKGIIRCCIMMTAFSMWLLWVTVYISQMNPLMGPRYSNTTLAWIAHSWGDSAKVASNGSGGNSAGGAMG